MDGKTNSKNTIIDSSFLVLEPIICYLLLEFIANADITNISPIKTILNILILALFEFLFFGISGNGKKAATIATVCAGIFGILNYYVIEFRSIPILAPDVTVIGTAANVAGNYSFIPNKKALIFLIIITIFFILEMKLMHGPNLCNTQKTKSKIIASNANYSKFKRLFVLISSLIFFFGFFVIAGYTDMLPAAGVNTDVFRPIKTANINGTMLNFTSSIHSMIPHKPHDYSKNNIKKIISNANDKVNSTPLNNQKKYAKSNEKPNIIVIMNESFCDLSKIGDLKDAIKNEHIANNNTTDILPYYHSIKKNSVKGNLYVSTFAGGTAQTEFEFLTGCSMMSMPVWTTPYQLYMNDNIPSFTTTLKEQGYSGNIAMHPYKESSYNRKKAYKSLGFSNFITEENMDIKKSDKINNYESDSADYKYLIKLYEKNMKNGNKNKPFYIFNVTIQNHSPYGKKQVNKYLDLLNKSDQSLKMLINYFSKVRRPTEIVFFGDHAPELPLNFYYKLLGGDENNLSDKKLMQRYQSAYLIWTNYNINKFYKVNNNNISANFLSVEALKIAGLHETPYQNYLSSLSHSYPIVTAFGYYDNDGIFHSREEDTANGKKGWPQSLPKDLNNYWSLSYNDIFDSGNRNNSCFKIH